MAEDAEEMRVEVDCGKEGCALLARHNKGHLAPRFNSGHARDEKS